MQGGGGGGNSASFPLDLSSQLNDDRSEEQWIEFELEF
jgi:hypothetical protein